MMRFWGASPALHDFPVRGFWAPSRGRQGFPSARTSGSGGGCRGRRWGIATWAARTSPLASFSAHLRRERIGGGREGHCSWGPRRGRGIPWSRACRPAGACSSQAFVRECVPVAHAVLVLQGVVNLWPCCDEGPVPTRPPPAPGPSVILLGRVVGSPDLLLA